MDEKNLPLRLQVEIEMVTRSVIATSAIEGEHLDPRTVRASVTRKLIERERLDIALAKEMAEQALAEAKTDAWKFADGDISADEAKARIGGEMVSRLRAKRWRAYLPPLV